MSKGNLVPMVVIGIIVFISYQSNPEYWKQGKLFTQMKTTSSSTIVDTKDVANIPAQNAQPAAKPYNGNQSSGSQSDHQPSVNGARLVPDNLTVRVATSDPGYGVLRSAKKIIYFNYPKSDKAEQFYAAIKDGLAQAGLTSDILVQPNFYTPTGPRGEMEKSSFPGQDYLNKNCTKYVCILNPVKQEIIFVNRNVNSVIAKSKELRNW